jgi:hypothetical protein
LIARADDNRTGESLKKIAAELTLIAAFETMGFSEAHASSARNPPRGNGIKRADGLQWMIGVSIWHSSYLFAD